MSTSIFGSVRLPHVLIILYYNKKEFHFMAGLLNQLQIYVKFNKQYTNTR